mgnify:CR=1 FL=1
MASKPWRAPGFLSGSESAHAVARRLTRRDWRKLRQLILRPEFSLIAEAIQNQHAERQQFDEQPKPVAWTVEDGVQALSENIDRATLFGSIRLLQASAQESEPLGYAINPDREPVRIDQALLLGFAGREIDGVAQPSRIQLHAGSQFVGSTRPVLTQNAVGLLGPNGPMPFIWTQYLRDLPSGGTSRPRQSFLAFINLVQRRQLSFLYRAWADALPVTAWDTRTEHPKHPVGQRLSAIAGVAHADLAQQDAVPPEFKQAFASTLSRRVRNPDALARMLSCYLDVPVRIEEFSSRWLEIPLDERTQLGVRYTRLGQPRTQAAGTQLGKKDVLAGEEAVAGTRTWDCNTRFDLVLGPLTLPKYLSLLPGSGLYNEVRDLVALYMGPEWEWIMVPLLQSTEVPQSQLGQPIARLGRTQWLGKRASGCPANDLKLLVRPNMHPNKTSKEK